MKLYVIIPDVHDRHPYVSSPHGRMSRKVYHPAYRCMLSVIKALKPNGIVNLGDTTDMESLSYFDMDKRRKMEGRRYQKDIQSLNHLLDEQEKVISHKTEKIYFIGNHEQRVENYLDNHPESEGMMNFEADVFLGRRGYEIIGFNQPKKLGKALFMHGFDATMYHAAKMSRTFDRTIYYGHVHDVQTHSFKSPINAREIRVAESLGCLCDLNPSWLLGKPNRWVHAFGLFWLKDNGEFQMDRKIVINGEVVINGKIFKG